MSYLLTILLIGLLIFLHELGHLLAAKAVGIPVARFSIGFGPVLRTWNVGGVDYCLSAIPLGGYVMPKIETEEEFFRIPVSRRIVFWLGGPAANFVTAAIMLGVMGAVLHGVSANTLLVEPWLQVGRLTGQLLAVIPAIFLHPDQLSGVVGIVAAGKTVMSDGGAEHAAVCRAIEPEPGGVQPAADRAVGRWQDFLRLLEKIHPRLARVHTGMAVVGLLLLLALMVYTTVLDVVRQLA